MNRNPIETKLEKKRKIISIILTVIFHFIFLLILLISGAFKIEKNESKVITVQLYDKIIEDFNKMDEAKKEKLIKETQKKYERIKKEEQKAKGKTSKEERERIKEEKKEIEQKDIITKEIITKEEKKEESIQKSSYEDYRKKIEEQKKREEEEFFKSRDKKDGKYDDNIDDLLNYKIDEDGGRKKERESNKGRGTEGSIKWEEGKSRELIYRGKITAPDEIVQKGLKVNLTLKFTVNRNGFIERVIILESTGNILWDNFIIEQFKKNYIFKESDVNSTGITEITINY